MENQQPSFGDKFNAPLKTLWESHKLFLIGFGIVILIWRFREAIIDLLVADSRKIVNEAKVKDSQLKSEEQKANAQADELVKQAEDLSKNKSEVDEDWYKK